jgi:hypothetical protein
MSPKIEKIKPLISNLSLNELDELKDILTEFYFQNFEKQNIDNIKNQLSQHYDNDFVNEITQGLLKSSIYEN